MPTATALRSFQHGADRYKKGDPVEYDAQTLKALARSGLVSKEVVEGNEQVTTPPPKVEKPAKAPRGGKKSSASPAAQASTPPTLPPLQPGVPPPLPDAQ